MRLKLLQGAFHAPLIMFIGAHGAPYDALKV